MNEYTIGTPSNNAPYLYLYIQSYCRISQAQGNQQKKVWTERFYAPDDEAARWLAQTTLDLKNERAIIPYVETGLERSTQDVHVDYFFLPATKEWANGTYRAVKQPETEQ